MDTEIRKVGAPIVLGTIPGIIAIVGCSNFPEEIDEVAEIAEEFAKRKYIVVLTGCSAMAAGMKKDKEGKTIYEKYPPNFDAGGVLNVGSCVANSHITGAAMKVANIFATLPLRGNYEVIADYILNRVGACGLAWGAYSQKAASIATGCNRLGIPVVLGPHSSKYRRLYMSRKEEDDWTVMDGREKKAGRYRGAIAGAPDYRGRVQGKGDGYHGKAVHQEERYSSGAAAKAHPLHWSA